MITTPLVACGDGQVELYEGLAEVGAAIECHDVHLYELFDATGRRLSLQESGQGSLARPFEPPQHAEEVLREYLLDWLRRVGPVVAPELEQLPLTELVWRVSLLDGRQTD